MNVIRLRRAPPREGEDDLEVQGADVGAPRAAPPPPRRVHRKTRLTAADVIAGAVYVVPQRRSPVDVLAGVLRAPEPGIHGALGDAFWNLWFEHRDYLKKKAFISSTATGRMPRMS